MLGSCWLLCVVGCAAQRPAPARPAAAPAPACPVPSDVQLEIEASDRVNPDEQGRSLPTRLRLYQLTDLSALEHASFDDVWARPQEVLAGAVLQNEELVIYPGQVLVHRVKRNDRADYIVGVAVFREPEGEGWRTAQEWPLPGDPCKSGVVNQAPALAKLRIRMFLEGNRIESVNNYALLPKRRCSAGTSDCAAVDGPGELRRNHRLQSFEENPLEPEGR